MLLALQFMASPSYGQSVAYDDAIEAITKSRYDLELGFTIKGLVAEVAVEPGQKVKKGQLLVKLNDREPAAILSQSKTQAESTLSIEAAEAQMEQAKIELASIEQMFERNATTKLEMDRAKVQVKLRELELALAKQERDLAQIATERAEANLEKYTITAPQDGVVVDVMVEIGETAEEREPAIQLVVTDPLRIDAAVPTAKTLKLKMGAPAWVTTKLDDYAVTIEGKVVYVSPVADAASDTRIVRVEIANEHNWPAGSHVLVLFEKPKVEAAVADGSANP